MNHVKDMIVVIGCLAIILFISYTIISNIQANFNGITNQVPTTIFILIPILTVVGIVAYSITNILKEDDPPTYNDTGETPLCDTDPWTEDVADDNQYDEGPYDWECPNCSSLNPDFKYECGHCTKPKTADAKKYPRPT